jgi:putative MATE family efflux protein
MKKNAPTLSWFSLLKEAFCGKNYDYTKGPLSKAIFLLAIPMVFEILMESVFALVDIYFVSKVSTHAVATVGLTESVITLVYAVAVGISMAATAVVARRIGEGNTEGARQAAAQVIYLGVGVSLLFSLAGIYFAKDFLALMKASPEVIEEGYQYTQILLGGNLTIVLLFLINAVFRGAGNASYAMWVLVFSNGLNIILDPLFIFGIGPFPE